MTKAKKCATINGVNELKRAIALFMRKIPDLLKSQIEEFHKFTNKKIHPMGCWIWKGLQDAKGYGVFWIGSKAYRAHRVAWTIDNGSDVPDGLMIMHTCDNPPCVNPNHLSPGTAKDNHRDAIRKRRKKRKIPRDWY